MARRYTLVSDVDALQALTAHQRKTWTRQLHAQRLINAGASRSQASREAHTSLRTMRRWLGTNPDAERYAYVRVASDKGVKRLPASRRETDLAHRYRDAVWRHANLNDDSGLADLEGEMIGDYELETGPESIDEMIARGELDPSEIGSGETAQ